MAGKVVRTYELWRVWHSEASVVMQDAEAMRPGEPVEIGVGGRGAEEEWAGRALVGRGYCFDCPEKVLLGFFLFGSGLRLD